MISVDFKKSGLAMQMIFRPAIAAAFIVSAAFATTADAATAPEALRGKTVTVTWTENREQTSAKDGQFRSISVGATMAVYVSNTGRAFARLTMRSRADEASQGTVGGSGGSLGGGVRQVNFTSTGFTISSNFGEAARRIVVEAGNGNCSASVTVAKLVGASTVRFTRNDGRKIEIRSISASGANCSVSNSNEFAR